MTPNKPYADEAPVAAGARANWGDRRPIPDPTALTTEALHREISHLAELCTKDVQRIDQVLLLTEQSRVEQKSDTKQALDAALAAQKEAVKEQTLAGDKSIKKSEDGTNKQITDLATTFNTSIAGITVTLGDLKERVTRIETDRTSGRQTSTEAYAHLGTIISVVVAFGSIITLALYISTHH